MKLSCDIYVFSDTHVHTHTQNCCLKFTNFLSFSVDDDLRVQITDNALARDLFPQDYHCLGDNENRPIKWLAIESLLTKTFTTASDVVSIYIYTCSDI